MENLFISYGNTDKKWPLPKFLIYHISPIMRHIINENKEIIINNEQFEEKDVDFLFNNLLLYPYYYSWTYKPFDLLIKELYLPHIAEIIKFYQMKNILYLIHDILNNTKIDDLQIQNFISYFELRQFFQMDKLNLPFFNLQINNFIMKNIFNKQLNLELLDDETKKFIINLILNKIKQRPYYGYIIDLDEEF